MILKSAKLILLVTATVMFTGCGQMNEKQDSEKKTDLPDQFIVVLGIAQDAGYPQAGCEKECCAPYYAGKEEKKSVTCLALVDRKAQQYWLLEATPDLAAQLKSLQTYLPVIDYSPDGILLTHAHIGHYTGLMHLGREAMGA